MISLLFSSLALAAACNPSAAEIAAWGAKAKTGVVFETERGIRTSSMDPAVLQSARSGNSCLNDAMNVASDKSWLRDPALQPAWKYLICERISGLSIVPNVHYRNGATAHVRVTLPSEERYREIGKGGRAEQGSCKEIFLKQIRENAEAVVQEMKARAKPAAPVAAKEIIQQGLSAPGLLQAAGRSSGAVAENARARKAAGAGAPGQIPDSSPAARGARGAE